MMKKTCTWNSSDYAQHSSAQSDWAQELIPKLRLQGMESVLDLGCGDGKMTLALAEKVPNGHVVGIDSSENMIDLAQQRLVDSIHQNVSFLLMDATALHFDNEFDVAFSNAALHWIKDHVAMLEGVKRSLKESGRILFQMGGRGNAQDIIDVVHALIQQEGWRQYFNEFSFPYGFYGPKEYEQWLNQVGLKQKRLELIPKDMAQEGTEGLAGWIRTTWLPYTQRIPEQLQETFVSEIVGQYIKAFPLDQQGKVHVKMARLEVEAIKQ
jgi:trans-aconitate 2-methyltransferase